jgi:hypothetical protein
MGRAVFHWIDRDKQSDMMTCVANALKPRGQFVFEFGGNGNAKLIHDALCHVFTAHGYSYLVPNYSPTIGEYASLLEETGFLVQYATLFDPFTPLKGSDGLKIG